MEKNSFERLSSLCQAMGVSGEENDVKEILKNGLVGDEWVKDRLGSLFCVKKSNNPSAKTLMIATSLDELGLMVSDYESDGTLKFVALEGISAASLLHQKVLVYTRDHKAYTGVVACNKVRFMEEPSAAIKMDMLVLDMGMTLEEAKNVFTIGDLVSFASECEQLGSDVVMGKQLNTRMMLEAIIEISERLQGHELDFNVAMGGIAQSIVGWRGTKTATYVVQPDSALVLCGFDAAKSSPKITRGNGMCVGVYDKQMLPGKRLLNDFTDQFAVQKSISFYGNDGSFIHKTLKGTPSLSLGVAMNHMGGPRVMASLSDFDDLVEKTVQYILSLNSAKIEEFGYGVNYD